MSSFLAQRQAASHHGCGARGEGGLQLRPEEVDDKDDLDDECVRAESAECGEQCQVKKRMQECVPTQSTQHFKQISEYYKKKMERRKN